MRKERAVKIRKRPVEARALASQHSFTCVGRTLHCDKCLRHSDSTEKGRDLFLQSPCIVDEQMVRTIRVGNSRPTDIPTTRSVQVGRVTLDASHRLCVYRGLYFCTACGYHASMKAQKLALECKDRSSAAINRVRRLRQGKLPSGLSQWPNQEGQRSVVQLEQPPHELA